MDDREFRDRVIDDLATLKEKVAQLTVLADDVNGLKSFRDKLMGGWLFVGGSVLLGSFALSLIALFG